MSLFRPRTVGMLRTFLFEPYQLEMILHDQRAGYAVMSLSKR
jgi:hypothetical protein